ncbi:MAG: DNA gyrase subunit A [Armatimonadetes bacterium]|nr:DNA gyrase subunit A [Armatimonadota bacterium]
MSTIAREIIPINIEDEMTRSYVGYAMSVNIARALPDVRDGLKPAQRRILVAMNDLRLTPNSQHRKCATIVGDTMGKYHPHGDQAIYPTLVRMAQDWNSRYPLIDGQGNMGSVDGDSPAAMRYTEARLSPLAMEMLEDLDKDTVNWIDNFDQRFQEPTILPGKFPNLLANGSSGIGVAMAANIPPQNLSELADGIIHLIDHPDASVSDLINHIKGPDFPTAGLILGTKGIRQAYETGTGSITMQAQVQIEPLDNSRSAIVITELPYQVNKTRLIEQIANLVRTKRIDGISGIDDYSDRTGMRVVVELKRDSHPKRILNFLLKHTALRQTFGIIMLALINGQPKVLNLAQILQAFVDHRFEVITRRSQYELEKARHRAHILEGLRIAIDVLDDLIKLIRAAKNPEVARSEMMERFGFSQIQADAILAMQLRQLTALERQKVEDEYKDILKKIAYYEDLLADPKKILAVIKSDLKYLKDKYGDERRTRIIPMEAEEIGDEDLIPDEETIVTITRDGYIKRVPMDTYRSQRRGGRGIIGANTKEEDTIQQLFVATTHHFILFFTNKGRVYRLKAYEVPQTSRQAMGTAIINLISIEPGDVITATVPVKQMDSKGYLVMATEKGEVKKTALSEFINMRANGLRAFDLEEDDELKWVELSSGNDDVILVTRNGLSIRFHEKNLRSAGRPAGGVRGINLGSGDRAVGMTLVRPDCELLVATELGYCKRTPITSYRKQTRGGKGLITMRLTEKTGRIVQTAVVDDTDKLITMTTQGIVMKCAVKEIRSCGRSTQGVRLINLGEGDTVASIARIPKAEANGNGDTNGAEKQEV